MPKVKIATVFQVRSTVGSKTISKKNPKDVLQIPIIDCDDFVKSVASCRPSKEDDDIKDSDPATMLDYANSLLPDSGKGDYTISDTVDMNSCLSGKDWKPCSQGSMRRGYVIEYQGAPLLSSVLMTEYDNSGALVTALELDVLIMLQVG